MNNPYNLSSKINHQILLDNTISFTTIPHDLSLYEFVLIFSLFLNYPYNFKNRFIIFIIFHPNEFARRHKETQSYQEGIHS